MFTSHRALLSLKSVIADYFWRGVIRFADRRICVPPFNPYLTTLGLISYSLMGSWGGAVVRALASHQCVPGSIPGPGVICGLSWLLVLALAPRVFLRVLRFSSLLKNQHF